MSIFTYRTHANVLAIHSCYTNTWNNCREILAYLDGVETSCTQTMQDTYGGIIPDSFRSDIEFAVEPDIIGDTPK